MIFKYLQTEKINIVPSFAVHELLRLDLLTLIADIFAVDMEEILDKIAEDNQVITKIIKVKLH